MARPAWVAEQAEGAELAMPAGAKRNYGQPAAKRGHNKKPNPQIIAAGCPAFCPLDKASAKRSEAIIKSPIDSNISREGVCSAQGTLFLNEARLHRINLVLDGNSG